MTPQAMREWMASLDRDGLARMINSYRAKRDAYRRGSEPRDVMRTLGMLLAEQDRRREARH